MERREFVYILLLTVSVMTSIHSHATLSSSSVGSCSPVQKSDLGGFFPSIEGIVPATFKSANGSGAPHVQIIKYHTVCEVPGRMKNTVGHLSVLVKYLCFGSNCPQNGGTSTNPQAVISQFQIQCHADTNTFLSSSGIASSIRGSTRVDHATADFSIANDTQCGACVDPATGTSGDQNNDPDTFCGGMLAQSTHLIIIILLYFYSIYQLVLIAMKVRGDVLVMMLIINVAIGILMMNATSHVPLG